MKIDCNIKSLTTGTVPEEQTRPPKPKTAERAEPAPSSNVQLSSLSANLQAIEKGFANTPVVDAARVSELKQAITEGRFKIDASKIADGLLKTAQELIRAHKS